MASERAKAANRVVVIGGGVSGLAAAHALSTQAAATRPGARDLEVLLLEVRDRVGGAIWTESRDGFTLEGGADSFITNKPAALELCGQLGLQDRLVETSPGRRRSFVVRNGRLVPVPDGFVMMKPSRLWPLLSSPILSTRGKLRFLAERFVPRRTETTEESLASFARRRFGREVFERLVQPLVGGIYTADPNELSIEATLSQFPEMERTYGSLIRGAFKSARQAKAIDRTSSGARYGLFLSLDEGMGLLPRTLASSLPRECLHTSTAVRRISEREGERGWRVELLDGSTIDAAAVVLSTESHAAARLLDGQDPELARLLRSIPYSSSVVANVAFRRSDIRHPLDGFGAVVPAIENRSILAVSFTSVKFPNRAPEGTVLLRVFVGGVLQPELCDLDDARIEAIVEKELRELLQTQGSPLLLEINRHTRSMPQYTIGHLGRVAEIERLAREHRGLFLCGNAYQGVGIPDCVRSAQEAAAAAQSYLARGERTAAA